MKTTHVHVIVVVAAGLCAPLSSQDASNDWLLVPGERVGPIGPSTSEADLRRLFSPPNVRPTIVYLGEGEGRPGTIVFPTDSTTCLTIVWRDTVARQHPEEIDLRGRRTRWHLANGVTLGFSLRDLERLNGRPFALSGWEHDAAGIVWGWSGGALETQMPITGVRIYFAPPSADLLSREERSAVAGDRLLTSDLASLRRANPGIAFIRLILSR